MLIMCNMTINSVYPLKDQIIIYINVLYFVGKNPTEDYLENMMNEAPGPINFTMFLTLFGERLQGTDPEDVIKNAFGWVASNISKRWPNLNSISVTNIKCLIAGPSVFITAHRMVMYNHENLWGSPSGNITDKFRLFLQVISANDVCSQPTHNWPAWFTMVTLTWG